MHHRSKITNNFKIALELALFSQNAQTTLTSKTETVLHQLVNKSKAEKEEKDKLKVEI